MPPELKLIEIRDRGTAVPAMAVFFKAGRGEADYLLRRAGFGVGSAYVILTNLNTCESQSDPFSWSNRRTMHAAHQALEADWERYASGDVLDVEFVLGETAAPKTSERFARPTADMINSLP